MNDYGGGSFVTRSRGNHGEARGGGIEIEHELASANGVGADGAVGVRREIEVGLVAVEMDDGSDVFELERVEFDGFNSAGDDFVADALKTTGILAGTAHDAAGLEGAGAIGHVGVVRDALGEDSTDASSAEGELEQPFALSGHLGDALKTIVGYGVRQFDVRHAVDEDDRLPRPFHLWRGRVRFWITDVD